MPAGGQPLPYGRGAAGMKRVKAMSVRHDEAVGIQRLYYTETAADYERMHAGEGLRDAFTRKFVESIFRMLDARSILDVGTATGRFLSDLRPVLPGAFLCGVEPVFPLLEVGRQSGALDSGDLVCGSGDALPFPDSSFDVVCEFATLHHVRRPNAIVREMTRVARKGVVLVDSNRFGQGSLLARVAKVGVCKLGLWPVYDWLRTRGNGYRITDGDGLSFSYSVFDSYELLSAWADRLILVPTESEKASSWLHPLLNSRGVLACAIKEG